MASLIRSSCCTYVPTYRTAAGIPARSDSTTELRPATNSAESPAPRSARPEEPEDPADPDDPVDPGEPDDRAGEEPDDRKDAEDR
jgi:hypothetical protein